MGAHSFDHMSRLATLPKRPNLIDLQAEIAFLAANHVEQVVSETLLHVARLDELANGGAAYDFALRDDAKRTAEMLRAFVDRVRRGRT